MEEYIINLENFRDTAYFKNLLAVNKGKNQQAYCKTLAFFMDEILQNLSFGISHNIFTENRFFFLDKSHPSFEKYKTAVHHYFYSLANSTREPFLKMQFNAMSELAFDKEINADGFSTRKLNQVEALIAEDFTKEKNISEITFKYNPPKKQIIKNHCEK